MRDGDSGVAPKVRGSYEKREPNFCHTKWGYPDRIKGKHRENNRSIIEGHWEVINMDIIGIE